MRRTFISVILLAFLSSFSLLFQNCGVAPSSQDGGGSSSSTASGGSTGGGGTTPAPGAETADQIAARECGAILGNPILSNISSALFDMNSGMGSKAGDSAEVNFTVTAKKNVTNTSRETQYDCARRTVTNILVQLNPGDAASSFSQAIDLFGNNVVGTATLADTISRSLQVNGSEADRNTMVGSVRVRVNRGNNSLRCVQGTVYAAISVQQTIQGNMDVDKRSTAQNIRVNLKNTCYSEARLKPQEGQFPFVANAGRSVSIDGNWAAAVVPKENISSSLGVGSISVHQFNGVAWVFHSKLTIPDAVSGEELSAVVVKGNNLIASSFLRKGRGGVYLFQYDGTRWVLQQTIESYDAQAGQYFGFSLAFNGSSLLVGAPHFTTGESFRGGAVFHYVLSGSRFDFREALVPPAGGSSSQGFGMSLAVGGSSNDTLLVGAPQAISYEADGVGAFYVFRLSGGSFASQGRVSAPVASGELSNTNGIRFGASVAIASNNQIAVGAPNYTNNTSVASGAAVFYASATDALNGTVAGRNVIKSGTAGANYGTAVGIAPGRLMVGAPYASATPQNVVRAGVVYSYKISGAVVDTTTPFEIYATNAAVNDGFGYSLGLNSGGSAAVIGALIKSDTLRDSGAVYISGVR